MSAIKKQDIEHAISLVRNHGTISENFKTALESMLTELLELRAKQPGRRMKRRKPHDPQP